MNYVIAERKNLDKWLPVTIRNVRFDGTILNVLDCTNHQWDCGIVRVALFSEMKITEDGDLT